MSEDDTVLSRRGHARGEAVGPPDETALSQRARRHDAGEAGDASDAEDTRASRRRSSSSPSAQAPAGPSRPETAAARERYGPRTAEAVIVPREPARPRRSGDVPDEAGRRARLRRRRRGRLVIAAVIGGILIVAAGALVVVLLVAV